MKENLAFRHTWINAKHTNSKWWSSFENLKTKNNILFSFILVLLFFIFNFSRKQFVNKGIYVKLVG